MEWEKKTITDYLDRSMNIFTYIVQSQLNVCVRVWETEWVQA